MSPSSSIGRSNASDVGGVGIVSNLDQAYSDLTNAQTPTLPGQEVLIRSECPVIDPVSTTATTISGTTTEPTGTIISVYVYQSNGTSLVGSGTVTTSSSNWSINVSTLSPAVTLVSGYKVKATATAPGKGASYDNCDIETVASCAVKTSTNVTITKLSGNKGFQIANTFPSGTIITWYKSDFTIASILSGNGGNIPNPVTTTAANQTILFECKTGQCFVSDVYYFTFQEPGKCVSEYLSNCQYSATGTSIAPVITTIPITTSTTSISGTCSSSAAPGTIINLYADGNFLKSVTVTNSTSWTISGLDLSGYSCKNITASATDGGKCPTYSAAGIAVTRQAFAPRINYSGCALTMPTSISGYSSEIGATIQLFKSPNLTTPIGTAVVDAGGTWNISTISPALASGNIIQAKVAAGGCITESAYSSPVTISTQTNISNYTIGITTPTEGQTTVSGTISGGFYPVVLTVYVDQALVKSITVNGAGSWTATGLNDFDLALGSKVQVTIAYSSQCESALSTTSATVQCLPPTDKTISGSFLVCANSYGIITVPTSELGVIYTPVAEDGATVAGYGGMGNGGNLSLTTYALVANPTVIKVKASKVPLTSCSITLTGSVTFNLNPQPAAPTAPSPQIYCGSGTAPTLAELAVTVPTGCIVKWYSSSTGGSVLTSTTQVIANTTYYAESESTATGCRSNTRTAVIVQSGSPAAPAASATQTFCAGASVANLTATLTGPGTISWFTAATGGTALSSSTILVNGSKYYAQTNQSGCVSTRTAVTATVNPIPTITATTPAFICGPGTVTLGATASTGTINWYDAVSNGNKLGTGNTFTTPLISTTTTYYVDATNNGCTTATRTAVVATVNAIPTITVTTAPACTPDFLTYSVGVTVSTGTVTSTTGTVVNTSGNVWSVSNVPKGTNITLTVTSNGCNKSLSITAPDCGCDVVALPVSGGDKQFCTGDAIPFISATVATGVTIDWYSAPSGGSPLLSDAPSYTPSAAGTYYAEARNISTGCKSSMRTAITITENPKPNISSMTTSACSGVGFTVTPANGTNGIVPAGTTYSWSAPSGTGFTGGQAGSGVTQISGTLINTTSTAQTATYLVTPVSGSCSGTAFTVTVTINPNASVTSVSGTSPMAMGTTASYTANSVVLGGGTGTWTSSNTTVATINATSGLVSALAPGSTNITYTISGGCGATTSASKVLSVVPVVNFTTASQISTNESGSLTIVFQLSAATSQPVTIPFTVGGTATGGSDFSISSSPITIPAGSMSGSITINITNDILVEGNETILLTMGTPVNAAQGDISVHTFTIKDDDFNPIDDADGDGVLNAVDADDDNDGILDSAEGSSDADGDGITNQVDLDSDNDGIYDILEAGGIDANFDGKVDLFIDANGNGVTDSYDQVCNGTTYVTGQANSIYSYTTYVTNPTFAVDADNTSYASITSYEASLVVQFQSLVSSGTAITIKMAVGATVNVEQSADAINFTNLASYSNPNTVSNFTYNLTSDANYLRFTRKSNKDILIYHITFPYLICNGNIGAPIPDNDSDNDGLKDRIEIDSDNDGCLDVKESGFTDLNTDGKLDGTGYSPLGIVNGNVNGYTLPLDAYLTSAYDYREYNPAAVGGTVSGSTSICSGSGSGTLTLSGYTGVISNWQSSVSPFSTWTDLPSTSTTYSAAILTETTRFRAIVVTSACSSAFSQPATITVRPTPTATISGTTSACQNGTAPSITFTNPQALPVTITYNINGAIPTTVNVNANSTASITVPTNVVGDFKYNLVSVAYQSNPLCSNNVSGSATVTVVASASSVAGTDMNVCYISGGINVTNGSTATNYAGILWTSSGTGSFSNATSPTLATYTPSQADITAGVVTLTLTAYGNAPCGNAISTKKLTISLDGSWTGAVSQEWNNPSNWACNQLPSLTTNVVISNGRPNYPIVSTEPAGMAKDISIASGASVTVSGGTLQIAGNISRSGTFSATEGTIEMKGTTAQTIEANVFEANTLKNLIVNNPGGLSLQGTLNIKGFVRPASGTLNSGGYLTLLSTATQTALIEGVGTGEVTGNVNIQRYLSSSFGYKYFSSPFKSATVAELADEVNLTESFATLYKYDENHSRDSLGITVYYSGWTKYTTTTNPLVPLYGYAANMGTGTNPVTLTMSGEVNNGALQTTLFNNNRKYTKGFNLVGNPYPSPIDWDAAGWTKTNIDNAIYFFNAGNTDRYTGVYSSYVNGISSGNANNVIAAMQGFFVHVSNGTYPVNATLGVSNSVRVNNLSPVFKKAMIDTRPRLRLNAGFEIKDAIADAAVIYFDPMARNGFEQDKDALKLINTDIQVPNIYTLSPDGRELSINGLSLATDSLSSVPVGITTFHSGWINLRAENVKDLTLFEQVILKDGLTGQLHDLRLSPDIRFYLDKGKYDRRFSLLFTKGPIKGNPTVAEKLFTVVRSGSSVQVKVNLPSNTKGNLIVTNILGQALLRKEVLERETVEISQGAGVYVITLVSGTMTLSEKILMRKDYE